MTWIRVKWETAGLLQLVPVWLSNQIYGRRSVCHETVWTSFQAEGTFSPWKPTGYECRSHHAWKPSSFHSYQKQFASLWVIIGWELLSPPGSLGLVLFPPIRRDIFCYTRDSEKELIYVIYYKVSTLERKIDVLLSILLDPSVIGWRFNICLV